MGMFGLGFAPIFWGFLAAVAESVGAFLVAIGFLTRPAALFVLLNMLVAGATHILGGDGLVGQKSAEMALLYAAVFLGIIFVGPGEYSFDEAMGE